MTARALLLAVAVVLAAGCGSSKKTTPGPPVHVLPVARTADEWAKRVVNRLLRPLNQDLVVLSTFDNPQIRAYIAAGNQETIGTVHKRMDDLDRCATKLATIGPPPTGLRTLERIDGHLRAACTSYRVVANKLVEATDLLAAGKQADGDAAARAARSPSRKAAQELVTAIRFAQAVPAFRRAGLKPSV